MDKYRINIKTYEGPMDLLLDLIKQNEIDIYDIPIAKITEQFLDYLKTIEKLNLEITSDFILMAATLIEIKSKMLLPKQVYEDEENEDEDDIADPRAELVQKLLEYEKFKKISNDLKESLDYESKAFYKLQEDFSSIDEKDFLKNLNLNNLLKTFNNIMEKHINKFEVSEIIQESFSTEDAIKIIKVMLEENKKISFLDLIKKSNKSEIITYFLSILEAIKMGILYAKQNKDFDDIILLRRKDEL